MILNEQFDSKTIKHTPQFIEEYCSPCLTNQLLTRLTNIEKMLKPKPVTVKKRPTKDDIKTISTVKRKVNKPPGE